MNKLAFFVLLCSLLACQGKGDTAAGKNEPQGQDSSSLRMYKQYSSEQGNFRFQLPAELRLKHKTVQSLSPEGDSISLSMDLAEDERIAYMLCYADYPRDYSEEADSFLQAIKKQMLAEFALKLIDEYPLLLDSLLPGLEFRAQSEETRMQSRLYLNKERLYQLLVVAEGKSNFEELEGLELFLNSFELIELPPPPLALPDSLGSDSTGIDSLARDSN